MNPNPTIASNRKPLMVVVAVVLIIIIGGALFYFIILKKPLPKLSGGPRISTKTEYKNPFDKKTQYVNPFETYKNPFIVAK